jgi:hypothetical protein
MSQLRVGSITDTGGNNALTLSSVSIYNTGVLQSVQIVDSSIMNFTGSYTQLGSLSINFTPKSATSKILITSNTSARNITTTSWTLYQLRLRVGDVFPYYRYVGHHYYEAYSPVEINFQVDSWGTTSRAIAVQAASHANHTHQFNSKIWDADPAGASSNTSVLRVTEFQTL